MEWIAPALVFYAIGALFSLGLFHTLNYHYRNSPTRTKEPASANDMIFYVLFWWVFLPMFIVLFTYHMIKRNTQ